MAAKIRPFLSLKAAFGPATEPGRCKACWPRTHGNKDKACITHGLHCEMTLPGLMLIRQKPGKRNKQGVSLRHFCEALYVCVHAGSCLCA